MNGAEAEINLDGRGTTMAAERRAEAAVMTRPTATEIRGLLGGTIGGGVGKITRTMAGTVTLQGLAIHVDMVGGNGVHLLQRG